MKQLNQLVQALAVITVGIGLFMAGAVFTLTAFGPVHTADAQVNTLVEIERSYADLYNQVAPSVVSINVDIFRGGTWQPWSTGSGFVIDSTGHIVTNYHVVESGDRVVVKFLDGTITRAEVTGLDPSSDVALLRVDVAAEKLTPLRFANSSNLTVGQTTLAIGSPFGQDWTLTTGIISALNRTIEGLTQFDVGAVIQTDAAINPGNSGGPLLNINGEVIGINTQILSRERANSGVGFAVPSNLVQRVIQDLISAGQVDYSYLGISGVDINIDFIETYNLPNDVSGVAVTNVASGGPAAAGGLLPLSPEQVDVITAVDGQRVRGFDDLVAYLASSTRPGEAITMTVYRSGILVDLTIVLGSRLNR
ncbi:MAG: S1C family serine protease [Chloroflexota bacterium]